MKRFLGKAGPAAGIFFTLHAYATTFGPITVVDQAQNTQYYVHGRVTSGPSVYMEPTLHRPYTSWTVQISEQTQGDSLGSRVTIREPGGEIGDTGYHVAGTAEFTVGEDVFVALRDTSEEGVKEVVGLASGKYRVEIKDGKQAVISGLGLPVSGNDGVALGPTEFTALLERIAHGQATEADRNVWVSRVPSHEAGDHGELEAKAREVLQRHPADWTNLNTDTRTATGTSVSTEIHVAPNPAASQENSVQESPPKADEGSTGFSGWIIAVAVLAALILGLFLALRR